jgi:uncharacterized coiled-coil protein SlyX
VDLEAKIAELEARIAYQDRTIADLDEVVREFADRVAVLERELSELRKTSTTALGPSDEPPPHY